MKSYGENYQKNIKHIKINWKKVVQNSPIRNITKFDKCKRNLNEM